MEEDGMVRACSTLGRDEKYKISVRKPEGKRSLKGPRHRWEDNRMVVMEYGGKVWTGCIWFMIGTIGELL
jgi:hypothetical protein